MGAAAICGDLKYFMQYLFQHSDILAPSELNSDFSIRKPLWYKGNRV